MRHHRDVGRANRKVRQVRHLGAKLAELHRQLLDLVVRQLEKTIEQTKLAHHFHRRRMNGIATKISQEISVLLQHDDLNACALPADSRA